MRYTENFVKSLAESHYALLEILCKKGVVDEREHIRLTREYEEKLNVSAKLLHEELDNPFMTMFYEDLSDHKENQSPEKTDVPLVNYSKDTSKKNGEKIFSFNPWNVAEVYDNHGCPSNTEYSVEFTFDGMPFSATFDAFSPWIKIRKGNTDFATLSRNSIYDTARIQELIKNFFTINYPKEDSQ